MNPRLVICLYASMLIGVAAGVVAFLGGIGPILACLTSSFTGSSTLLATTLAAAWLDDHWPPAQLRRPATGPAHA